MNVVKLAGHQGNIIQPRYYSKNAEDREGNQLVKDPGLIVFHEEEDRVLIPVRIDGADDEGGNQGAEKGPP